MRGRGTIAACVGLVLLASGCDTLDGTYLREGVGTAVTSTDIVTTTNLQEIYFGELCRQASLGVVRQQDGTFSCDDNAMRSSDWTLLVQAGMNDIDRRCDAYLVWLDDRRRWREPILKQINSTAAASAAIMGLSGVGAGSIAIVGAAFGFAQETFVNISGRLITEVNHSTVQSLVLTRQNDYRDGLKNKVIPSGPAAVYTLRSYLRICMPMTIETEINTTITSVDRTGGPPAALITPATIAATAITDVNRPPPTPPKPPGPPKGDPRFSDIERNMLFREVSDIQAALCVRARQAELGRFGDRNSDTRNAIRNYLRGRGASNPPDTVTDETIRASLNDAVDQVRSCAGAGFLNGYEVGFFGIPPSSTAKKIAELQKNLNLRLKDKKSATVLIENGTLDSPTRNAIAEFRDLTPGSAKLGNQLDQTLARQIRGE